jgi:hypothetical protein
MPRLIFSIGFKQKYTNAMNHHTIDHVMKKLWVNTQLYPCMYLTCTFQILLADVPTTYPLNAWAMNWLTATACKFRIMQLPKKLLVKVCLGTIG